QDRSVPGRRTPPGATAVGPDARHARRHRRALLGLDVVAGKQVPPRRRRSRRRRVAEAAHAPAGADGRVGGPNHDRGRRRGVSGALSGALLPLFVLATGALAGAVRGGHSITLPLAAVVGAFLLERVLDPVLEESGQALWRQVDESLSQRIMRAVAEPPGLAAV